LLHFVRNDNFIDFLREHQNFILLYLLYPKKLQGLDMKLFTK